jgi:exopolyphosphatase / guanosine-5'-triphosphate,3'-diphosphate pyrophosphatase
LVFQAITSRIPLLNHQWVLVDLGGGSVEVSLINHHGVMWSQSNTMGSVRLLEELNAGGNGNGTDKLSKIIEDYVSTLKLPHQIRYAKINGFIATGGNIEDLAKLCLLPPGENGVAILPLSKLQSIIEVLFRLSYKERIAELNLRPDRADVILPAALVYERLCRLSGMKQIIVPGVGTKEGVLIDLAKQLSHPQSHEKAQEILIEESCHTLGIKYMYDELHARHVKSLSMSLFEQLQAYHQLTLEDRKLLIAASLLHDIGTYISYSSHHKHSMYLIQHEDLASFNENQKMLIAQISRYHRKSSPNPNHSEYRMLSPEDQQKILLLSSILRIADACDREHLQKVHAIRVHRKRDNFVFQLHGEGDLNLEIWALKKKVKLFEEAFRSTTEIGETFLGGSAYELNEF